MTDLKLSKKDFTGLVHNENHGKLTIVEYGEWEDDGKYQHLEVVFKHDDHPDKHFIIYCTRSGSYYSDYWYSYEDDEEFEAKECYAKEVTKIEWFEKKED